VAVTGRQRVVVIGNGMAGCRVIQELAERDAGRALRLTVIGDEPGGAYNRARLSAVLAGQDRATAIGLASPRWLAERGVTAHAGTAAVAIDRAARLVRLADGCQLPWDTLILATGSRPVLPPVPGLTVPAGDTVLAGDTVPAGGGGGLRPGIVALRTLADCAAIDAAIAAAGRAGLSAVVAGAGVLGLETARGLAVRGARVTLLQRSARLMERELDAGASRVLARTAAALGVRVRAGALGSVPGRGRVRAVELADGTVLDAGLLVLCCGIRPRTALARQAGLATGSGVLVDDQLRTSDPRIYAIGECAEHRGRVYGLAAPAWEQARVAARAITEPGGTASYAGSRTVTRLKADGIELASLGEALAEEDDGHDHPAGGDSEGGDGAGGDGAEVIRFTDRARGVYQKLVVRDGRLAGAILVGDTRAAAELTQLFDRGAALPADRSALLLARRGGPAGDGPAAGLSAAALPGRATVCRCNGVTKDGICAAWQDGARKLAEVADRTRAMTGCGTCRDLVGGVLAWLTAGRPGDRDTAPPDAGASGGAAGPAPAGPVPAGSVPAGSVPADPMPAGPGPAGSGSAGSVPAGSVPAGLAAEGPRAEAGGFPGAGGPAAADAVLEGVPA
jgi:assimilatory nitrate reductase electron transfer subunit